MVFKTNLCLAQNGGNILLTLQGAEQQYQVSVVDLSEQDRTCSDINFSEWRDVFYFYNGHGTFVGGDLVI